MAERYLGESIGKLGFGFMRLPQNDKRDDFDYEQINNMVDAFLDAGFTYFDTAFVYTGSEVAMNKTLVTRHPRDTYTIASKLNLMFCETPEAMHEQFETSLARLGTDYIDFYLLHGLSAASNEKAESFGAWDYVKQLKAEGKVRHWGFSFHDDPEALESMLTAHPDAEFVQLQINYYDWDSEDVQSRRLYEIARAHHTPIVIMEPVKGGLLASTGSPLEAVLKKADPDASVASWAVRFATTLDGVITMLSGMSTMEQLQDNLKTVSNLQPLTDGEKAVIDEAVTVLRSTPRVPCTDCKYCVENCPQQINIPLLFNLYNNYLVHNTTANSEFPFMMATQGRGKPSDCIACGMCEQHCPQHIGIADLMKKMVPLYES